LAVYNSCIARSGTDGAGTAIAAGVGLGTGVGLGAGVARNAASIAGGASGTLVLFVARVALLVATATAGIVHTAGVLNRGLSTASAGFGGGFGVAGALAGTRLEFNAVRRPG
jgi:hypothetical protein